MKSPRLAQPRGDQRLEIRLRPRAVMRDHFGGGDRADAQRSSRLRPCAWPARKPAAKRSPAPVVSTTLATGSAAHRGALAALDRDRALLAAGDDQGLDLVRDRRDRLVEIVDAGELLDLGLVGEEDVDPAARRSGR